MAQFRTSRRFDIAFLISLGLFLLGAVFYRTQIGDWVFFQTHSASVETVAVASAAGLNAKGLHLLERTNPQFATIAVVNANCDVERLGCLNSHDQAYILDDPAQHDQTVVTTAHEMLHLAYQRLSNSQKSDLAPLLDQAIAENTNNGLGDELSGEKTAADRRDEAHSLLGTEYKNLPAALEQYYNTYFTDRTKVLDAYTRSQQAN
ncbi:hypothetical protein HJC99_02025 [Candidatus Saccharibacteria bacterium]|nr:hypothetical protein [Candidatus Saccharibacteria bacterium]